METEGQLKKDIGLSVAMSLVIGTVIGSGIFMKPGVVIEYAGSANLALIAWLLGGVITIAGGLTIAEVGVQIPKTGGLYVYMEEVYGKVWGYLCGWMQTIIYGPAIIGALGLYFGLLLANLFYLSEAWYLPLGIGAVIFLAVVNSYGTKYGGSIQTITTIAKFAPILLIGVLGIWKGNEQVFSSGSPVMDQLGMGAAILTTLFAYDGWMLLGFVAGEMKNPAKHLPIAIVGGLTVVTAVYMLVNVAMLKVLPPDEIVLLGTASAGKVAEILMGGVGAKIISVGILISIFGCLNGKILTFPRVPFAMAERRQLPFSHLISKVHPKWGTPVAAIVMQVILAVFLMVVSNPDYLSELAIFAIYLFYIMAFMAVFILRKRRGSLKREYSVPLYPFIPLAAIAGSLFVVLSTLLKQPIDSMWAIGVTLIGLPVYYYLQKKDPRQN